MDPLEFVAIVGCSMFFAWMFSTFYWLEPAAFAAGADSQDIDGRNAVQMVIFIGLTAGYVFQWVFFKKSTITLHHPVLVAIEAACVASLPLVVLASARMGLPPLPALGIVNFATGFGAAFITNSWLDAPSRFHCERLSRFYSLSLLVGGALFVLVAIPPLPFTALFTLTLAGGSIVFLRFTVSHSTADDFPPVSRPSIDTWTKENVREVEPSLVAFNMVFGLTFCVLGCDRTAMLLAGLASSLVGSFAILMLDRMDIKTDIVMFQRLLLAVDVTACVVFPFAPSTLQLVCACCVIASWAAFLSVNYAHMVKKGMLKYEMPVFRQLPQRVMFAACGFAAGWALATIAISFYGNDVTEFRYLFLAMVVGLVLVVMVFFPVDNHHLKAQEEQGMQHSDAPEALPSETELFQRRIEAISRRYGLSARETEVFSYLAKGRNASYIQEKLVLSPHTVKTHTYHVYSKLDIHSQQKLMDFVESHDPES